MTFVRGEINAVFVSQQFFYFHDRSEVCAVEWTMRGIAVAETMIAVAPGLLDDPTCCGGGRGGEG